MKLRFVCLLSACLFGSTLASAEVSTVEVTYRVLDFYNPTQPLNDSNLRVTARNEATAEIFETNDRSQTFTLPEGTYTFSGSSNFCFLSEVSLEITASTTS